MPPILRPARATASASYWRASREPRYSITFALPLFLLYEGLAAALSGPRGAGVRNGADVILKGLVAAVVGPNGPLIVSAAIVLVGTFLVARDLRRSREPLRVSIFGAMLAEAALLAALFGVVIGFATMRVLHPLTTLAITQGAVGMDAPTRLMISLGAGLYEELLFRVILVGALVMGGRVVLGLGSRGANAFAVIVGALVFSAFHYIGPYGDPFGLESFTFRALSGLAFSALYVTRGFGITAWTHALYDVFLLVL
jgi:hypothetical protein